MIPSKVSQAPLRQRGLPLRRRTCAEKYRLRRLRFPAGGRSRGGNFPAAQSATVTAGLRCAPETAPSAYTSDARGLEECISNITDFSVL